MASLLAMLDGNSTPHGGCVWRTTVSPSARGHCGPMSSRSRGPWRCSSRRAVARSDPPARRPVARAHRAIVVARRRRCPRSGGRERSCRGHRRTGFPAERRHPRRACGRRPPAGDRVQQHAARLGRLVCRRRRAHAARSRRGRTQTTVDGAATVRRADRDHSPRRPASFARPTCAHSSAPSSSACPRLRPQREMCAVLVPSRSAAEELRRRSGAARWLPPDDPAGAARVLPDPRHARRILRARCASDCPERAARADAVRSRSPAAARGACRARRRRPAAVQSAPGPDRAKSWRSTTSCAGSTNRGRLRRG